MSTKTDIELLQAIARAFLFEKGGCTGLDLSQDQLVQAGWIGLKKAKLRYRKDHPSGACRKTFYTHHIRWAMTDLVEDASKDINKRTDAPDLIESRIYSLGWCDHRSQEDYVLSHEIYGIVVKVLDARHLDIFIRRAVHGCTMAELAIEYNLSKSRIFQLYHRALRKIRRRLRVQ